MPVHRPQRPRAEEPDAEIVPVWVHPHDGPQFIEEDPDNPGEALGTTSPQCAECGSFDADEDEPYRIEPDAVVCTGCGHRYRRTRRRADETVF